MARHSTVAVEDLDEGYVLVPERYDPLRNRLSSSRGSALEDLVELVNEQVSPKKASAKATYLVIDTGDAQEGLIVSRKTPLLGADIGSNKKIVRSGDVIISRLRPYLRQVALVDRFIVDRADETVVSTEFYVLRARDGSHISYLVPWLLSDQVQDVLAAAQEGGHHPRFNSDLLLSLPVPDALVEKGQEISKKVEKAAHLRKQSDDVVTALIELATETITE